MRYNKEVSTLKKQEREIVKGELKNIDEVEADEQLAAINPDDFLFNISSKQIEIPLDFDQSGFISNSEITIRGSSSLQGSQLAPRYSPSPYILSTLLGNSNLSMTEFFRLRIHFLRLF